MKRVFAVLLVLFVLACELPEEAPTPTPKPTATATPVTVSVLPGQFQEAKALYNELDDFKFDAQFKQVGFGVCCKYNKWLQRVERLDDKVDGWEFLGEYGFAIKDIEVLAMSYAMGDYNSTGTMKLRKKIEDRLR